MKRNRVKEVLLELQRKNIKKIDNKKINDMQRNEEFDYDLVMNFYANHLKNEKQQFENEKKTKLKEVELWARAQREEEKKIVEKYCENHGEEDMKLIQKAIVQRHE